MQLLIHAAGGHFRDRMRQVDIEEFFKDHGIDVADGSSKAEHTRNTLKRLPKKQALDLILEHAQEFASYELEEQVFSVQDQDRAPITRITRTAIAEAMGKSFHGNGFDVRRVEGIINLQDNWGTFEPSIESTLEEKAAGSDPMWGTKEVFEFVGAFEFSTTRFIKLIESALDPLVRSEEEQASCITAITPALKKDGYQVVPGQVILGRRTYHIVEVKRGTAGTPKNLIFASRGPKPVLGFSDAVDNDVVILKHSDSCLIYDRPINEGLLWEELVAWWSEMHTISHEEARRTLGRRLLESLDPGPETEFFSAYFRLFRDRFDGRLPALLPQVYLHYDPEVAALLLDRDALFRQRMDFLVLLPNRQRVVIEIDGKHHYARGDKACPSLYARMVSADRALRLRGYEVYRFGGAEFFSVDESDKRSHTEKLVGEFFENLFRAHDLS